jgi:hypothetical protein
MSIQPAWQQTFTFFDRPIVVEPSHVALSRDAGLLPLRQFDERIALTKTFADALADPRRPGTHRAHVPGDGPQPRLRHPRRLRGSE